MKTNKELAIELVNKALYTSEYGFMILFGEIHKINNIKLCIGCPYLKNPKL